MNDASVSRVLDMQSPSGTIHSSGSSSGSGSKKSRVVDLESPASNCEASGNADKKRRVIVDLDDIDSEPEDEADKFNQELVQVKIEPED